MKVWFSTLWSMWGCIDIYIYIYICLSCMVEIGSYEPLPDLLFSWGSVAAEFEWRARIQTFKPFHPQA